MWCASATFIQTNADDENVEHDAENKDQPFSIDKFNNVHYCQSELSKGTMYRQFVSSEFYPKTINLSLHKTNLRIAYTCRNKIMFIWRDFPCQCVFYFSNHYSEIF